MRAGDAFIGSFLFYDLRLLRFRMASSVILSSRRACFKILGDPKALAECRAYKEKFRIPIGDNCFRSFLYKYLLLYLPKLPIHLQVLPAQDFASLYAIACLMN